MCELGHLQDMHLYIEMVPDLASSVQRTG
jgi:hypothetical protein